MRLEHVAVNVPDPEAFMTWWAANLGMRRSPESVAPFIADDSGTFVLEVLGGEKPLPPSTLHIAFHSADVKADAARLEAAGAKILEQVFRPGFEMAMLQDPQGVAIQLIKRSGAVSLPPL